MKMNAKRLTALSLATALAMIFSFVESQIPALVAIPGIKLGIANTVTVALLYLFTPREAASVSLIRILLTSLLFGNAFALIYSLSGAFLSFVFMLIAKKLLPFGKIGISVIGGVMHNLGQIIAAAIVMKNAAIFAMLPTLLVSGTLAGVAIGVIAGIVISRLDGHIKI